MHPLHRQKGSTMNVTQKVIVVTGAGNGMGRETTLELARRGATIAAIDINQTTLDETVALAGPHGSRISTHLVDVTNLEQVRALPAAVIALHGGIDGLINVAGIIHKFRKVNDLSYDEIHRVMNVNFYGTVHMVKEFLPHLLTRPAAQILNIASMGGYVPVPGQTIYCASKAAIKLFSEGLRAELTGTNVGVSILFPGAIATNISVNSGAATQAEVEAMSKQGTTTIKTTPADVAGKLIVGAFEGNPFHAFAGSDAKLMYWWGRLLPEGAANMIQKQMASLLK
jgi:NAD(P)-dependent dehydrogenase (short-subunit alcohol dehydrogenase family)